MEIVETHSYEETHEETDAEQSLLNLSGNSSATQIRILKLNEFCKLAETTLQIFETKIQSLSAAKSDALKTRSELLVRQKINEINLNSLFQTRNEFFNYKSDVKTCYIEEQVMLKNRRMKYVLFMSSYTSNWEEVEREHSKIPMASEILMIQTENMTLNDKSTELQNLLKKTEDDYFREIRNYRKVLINKTVEFAKECQIYYDFLKINQDKRSITNQLEKLLHLQKSLNQKPRIADILKISVLEMITENPNRENIRKDAFSLNLKEFDMLIPLESLPLEVLQIPFENDSLVHSSENLVNLDNPENSNAEKNLFYNSPPPELNNNYKNSINTDQESNNYDGDSNENMDVVAAETENNTKSTKVHVDDDLDNETGSHRTQHEETPASSPSCNVSQFWNQTPTTIEAGGEMLGRKVKGNNTCIPVNMWKEMGETNPKKKKYSTDDIDFSNSVPHSNSHANSNSTSNNLAKNVRGNYTEEIQQQDTKSSASREKFITKEPIFSSGFWNINQTADETNDKSEDINYFSFLPSGDGSDRTKTGMGSSIFTLF